MLRFSLWLEKLADFMVLLNGVNFIAMTTNVVGNLCELKVQDRQDSTLTANHHINKTY